MGSLGVRPSRCTHYVVWGREVRCVVTLHTLRDVGEGGKVRRHAALITWCGGGRRKVGRGGEQGASSHTLLVTLHELQGGCGGGRSVCKKRWAAMVTHVPQVRTG